MTLKKTLERVVGSVACAAMVSCGYDNSSYHDGGKKIGFSGGSVQEEESSREFLPTMYIPQEFVEGAEEYTKPLTALRNYVGSALGTSAEIIFNKVMKRYEGKKGEVGMAQILAFAAPHHGDLDGRLGIESFSRFRQVAAALDTPEVQYLIDFHQEKKVIWNVIYLLRNAAFSGKKQAIITTAKGLEQYVGAPAFEVITSYFARLSGNRYIFPQDEWGAKFVALIASPEVQRIIKSHQENERRLYAILEILDEAYGHYSPQNNVPTIAETIKCLQLYTTKKELVDKILEISELYQKASSISYAEVLAEAKACNDSLVEHFLNRDYDYIKEETKRLKKLSEREETEKEYHDDT